MGFLQKLLDAIGFAKPQCKVLCVGLDNSGKSTVIQHLKPKQVRAASSASIISFTHRSFCSPALKKRSALPLPRATRFLMSH
jgi:ADP-ribosylation factor-like protein 6